MRLAVLYASKYGATRSVAEAIASLCREEGMDASDVSVTEIGRSTQMPDADVVLVGAPVYAGLIPGRIRRFLEQNLDSLTQVRLGLFLCCLYSGTRAEQQLSDNVPTRLLAHSFTRHYVGGRVDFDSLRFCDRQIMKRVGRIDHTLDTISNEAIRQIVADVLRR